MCCLRPSITVPYAVSDPVSQSPVLFQTLYHSPLGCFRPSITVPCAVWDLVSQSHMLFQTQYHIALYWFRPSITVLYAVSLNIRVVIRRGYVCILVSLRVPYLQVFWPITLNKELPKTTGWFSSSFLRFRRPNREHSQARKRETTQYNRLNSLN